MKKAFPYALRATLPVMTGYVGASFAAGLMLQQAGYGLPITFLMVMLVYSGALQFIAVGLLAGSASFWQVGLVAFAVNCRHLLYGIPFVEKFRGMDARRWYVTYALTDETFALLSVTPTPGDVLETDFYFLIAALNQCYWLAGSLLGNVVGQLVRFDFTGVDFAMTALFIVTFVEQWKKYRSHIPALVGIACALVCLWIFGMDNMLIPAMLVMIAFLFALRGNIEQSEEEVALHE